MSELHRVLRDAHLAENLLQLGRDLAWREHIDRVSAKRDRLDDVAVRIVLQQLRFTRGGGLQIRVELAVQPPAQYGGADEAHDQQEDGRHADQQHEHAGAQ